MYTARGRTGSSGSTDGKIPVRLKNDRITSGENAETFCGQEVHWLEKLAEKIKNDPGYTEVTKVRREATGRTGQSKEIEKPSGGG